MWSCNVIVQTPFFNILLQTVHAGCCVSVKVSVRKGKMEDSWRKEVGTFFLLNFKKRCAFVGVDFGACVFGCVGAREPGV